MNPDSKRGIFGLLKGFGGKSSGQAANNPQASTKSKRLMVIAGGALILLLAFWAVSALISSGGNQVENSLVKVAQRQSELIRLSDLGVQHAQSASTSALATNTRQSMQTSQTEVGQILARLERILTPAEKKALQSKEVDEQIEQARQAGNFDEAFLKVLRENLHAYRMELQIAYKEVSAEENKLILQQAYDAAGILLGD